MLSFFFDESLMWLLVSSLQPLSKPISSEDYNHWWEYFLSLSDQGFNSLTYLSKKSLSTTAQMSNKGFPIPKSVLALKKIR